MATEHRRSLICALDSEPFVLVARHGPARVARTMARVYAGLDADPLAKLTQVTTVLLGAAVDPLAVAALKVAAHSDTVPTTNPYHNAQHTLEVLLNIHYLALRNDKGARCERLSPHEHRLLHLAALVHDLDHDGGVNGAEPYRLERRSLVRAAPCLEAAGVDEADRRALSVMVLATDPATPSRHLRTLHRWTFLGEGPPSPGPPELAVLLADRRLLRLAALLSDADLLSSAGLTSAHAARQTAKLGAERGRPFSVTEISGFFDHIVGGRFATAAGQFFNPNLERLRAFVAHGRRDGRFNQAGPSASRGTRP